MKAISLPADEFSNLPSTRELKYAMTLAVCMNMVMTRRCADRAIWHIERILNALQSGTDSRRTVLMRRYGWSIPELKTAIDRLRRRREFLTPETEQECIDGRNSRLKWSKRECDTRILARRSLNSTGWHR